MSGLTELNKPFKYIGTARADAACIHLFLLTALLHPRSFSSVVHNHAKEWGGYSLGELVFRRLSDRR